MTTKQETFNVSVGHLRKQQAKSILGAICMYRGPNGLQCAIGPLIPELDYCPVFESMSIQGCHSNSLKELLFQKLGHNRELCIELQLCHDRAEVENWENALEKIAIKHGLAMPRGTK